MRLKRFLPLFILALIFNVEVMGAVGCKGLHNYLDMVLNKQVTAKRALEVQTRLTSLTADGAEVSVEVGGEIKRVVIDRYEDGKILYRYQDSDEVITQTLNDDFDTFFKLADEIPPQNVATNLPDGAALQTPPDVDSSPDLSLTRVDDPEVRSNLPALRTPDVDVPPRRPSTDLRVVEPDNSQLPAVRTGTDVAVIPRDGPAPVVQTDIPELPAPRVEGSGSTAIALRDNTLPAVDASRTAPELRLIPAPDDAPPRVDLLPAPDEVLRLPAPVREVAERVAPLTDNLIDNSIPLLAKADFPSDAATRMVEIKSFGGQSTYRGKIVRVNDQSIVLEGYGRLDFRDLDATSVRFLNDAGEVEQTLELAEGVTRRRVPSAASFDGADGKQIVIMDTSGGRVTHQGVIDRVEGNRLYLEGRENPLMLNRLDADTIRFVEEADGTLPVVAGSVRGGSEVAVISEVTPPGQSTALTLRRTEVDTPRPRAGSTQRIDRVQYVPADETTPRNRLIYDQETGTWLEDTSNAIGYSRTSQEIARLRTRGGERLLEAADTYALSLEDITGATRDASRFAREVQLPATANDLLGAYRNQFVRIDLGEGVDSVEGILRRIDGNTAVVEVDGALRRVELPDFNPDRIQLGNIDDVARADSSVIFVDSNGNAVTKLDALDDMGRAIPDEAAVAAINRGARFVRIIRRGTEEFLEFIHNGKKMLIPRRILNGASMFLRKNGTRIGRAAIRAGRVAAPAETLLDDQPEVTSTTGAPPAADTTETATDDGGNTGTPANPDGTPFETPYTEDGGETDSGNTSNPDGEPAAPYSVPPNQSFFGAAKQLMKQGWSALQGLW